MSTVRFQFRGSCFHPLHAAFPRAYSILSELARSFPIRFLSRFHGNPFVSSFPPIHAGTETNPDQASLNQRGEADLASARVAI